MLNGKLTKKNLAQKNNYKKDNYIPDRIKALKTLHDAGCKTWVSIEPYPTPNMIEQNFDDILNAVAFVDKIIFGRLHYNKEVTAYKKHKEFFNDLANKVIDFCNQNKIAYHIKTGTITDNL